MKVLLLEIFAKMMFLLKMLALKIILKMFLKVFLLKTFSEKSSCMSALSTGVFFTCFTVYLADPIIPLDICKEEEMEECWS